MSFTLMIESGRVELHEFHILHGTFGTVYHGFTVARSNTGICRCLIDRTATTGTHQHYFTEICIHLFSLWIEYIRSITFYVGSASCNFYAEMMLRDDFYSEMILFDFDIRVFTYSLHQSALNLCTGIVGMVQNSEFRMSPFTVQIKFSSLLFIEVYTPVDKFLYLRRSVLHHLFHSLAITDEVTGNHRVLNMFVEVIYFEIRYRSYTALCKRSICFIKAALTYHTYFTFMRSRYFKGVTHTGNS